MTSEKIKGIAIEVILDNQQKAPIEFSDKLIYASAYNDGVLEMTGRILREIEIEKLGETDDNP